MRLLLTSGCLLISLPLWAQQTSPPRPGPGRTSQNALLGSAYGGAGRVPGYYRYAVGGLELTRRNRWRYQNAEYDSDFTLGLRLGVGRQQTSFAALLPNRTLWGLNPYVAVDGRFFGAALGVWLGQLGNYRAEGGQVGRVVPQVRARAGQLTGWHGQLTYADGFSGLGNPPVLLGGGYGGLLRGRLRLGAGAAIPTLAPLNQEIGGYVEAGWRALFGEVSLYAQPPLGPSSPGNLGLQVHFGGSNPL